MHMKDFVLEIYREGGITAAANKMYVSQPALSASLKRVEDEIGMKLFDRASSPIKLTKAGQMYIDALMQINSIKKNLKVSYDDMKGLKTGNVSVGGAHFITSFCLLRVIHGFSQKYPGIKINPVESDSSSLKEKLLHGELDIVADYDFDKTYFTSYPLFKERILLCIPKGNKINRLFSDFAMTRNDIKNNLHNKKEISQSLISNLNTENFILMRKGNNMEKYSRKILSKAPFTPTVLLATDQLVTAYEGAAAGIGITFVTDSIIKSIDDGEGLLYYALDEKSSTRTLYLACNKSAYLSHAAEAFIEFASRSF